MKVLPSHRAQRQAKSYGQCRLASPMAEKGVFYDEYHLITVRHGWMIGFHWFLTGHVTVGIRNGAYHRGVHDHQLMA